MLKIDETNVAFGSGEKCLKPVIAAWLTISIGKIFVREIGPLLWLVFHLHLMLEECTT